METNVIYNEDCITGMQRLPDGSIDCILTDPPYLYLKGQKLDRPFDEAEFFAQCKRVLKKSGFIVLFGRGTSFYRWNTRLADLGFQFKEEVVWNKRYVSNPLGSLMRVHETISIHSLGLPINPSRIPFIESKRFDIESCISAVSRLMSIFHNAYELNSVKTYLNEKKIALDQRHTMPSNISISSEILSRSRCASTMKAIQEGALEKSIISEVSDKYKAIHPTQKPVRLLERLMALVTKEGDIVLDPFSGSASTAVACINKQRQYIGFEIDKEYYDLSMKRLFDIQKNGIEQSLFSEEDLSDTFFVQE